MSRPGETMADLPKGWVDQLWHDMKAEGRTKFLDRRYDVRASRRTVPLTPEHKEKLRAGLRAYWERRRAQKGAP